MPQRIVGTSAYLANVEGQPGDAVYVWDEGVMYDAVPLDQAVSNAIAVLPSDLDPIAWQQRAMQIIDSAGARTSQPTIPRVHASITERRFAGGAVSGQDSTAACRAAIAYLKEQGAAECALEIPEGDFLLTPDVNSTCLLVDFAGLRIVGRGPASQLRVTSNAAIPIHVSTEPDITADPETMVDSFRIENVRIRGTGVYAYYGLANGRGILLRGVKKAAVRHCDIIGMSMIGVATERGGCERIDVSANFFDDCGYTAVNVNGRGWGSVISRNVISGTGGGTVNSCAIEITGQIKVISNVVYGHRAGPTNYGGIMWGEGNFDGQSDISDNLITWCRYGVLATQHAACSITHNLMIDCFGGGGGIVTSGIVGEDYDVHCSHLLISNNRLINCAPHQILVGTDDTVVEGNICRRITDPVNPAGDDDEDSILDIAVDIGICIRAQRVNVHGNHIDGARAGISLPLGYTLGAVGINTTANCTRQYALEAVDAPYGSDHFDFPLVELAQVGSARFHRLTSAEVPTESWHPVGSQWTPATPAVGYAAGALCVASEANTTDATMAATDTEVPLASATAATRGSVVGVVLDNASVHWSRATSVDATSITLAAGIPASRSVAEGAAVYSCTWRMADPILYTAGDTGATPFASSRVSKQWLAQRVAQILPGVTGYVLGVGDDLVLDGTDVDELHSLHGVDITTHGGTARFVSRIVNGRRTFYSATSITESLQIPTTHFQGGMVLVRSPAQPFSTYHVAFDAITNASAMLQSNNTGSNVYYSSTTKYVDGVNLGDTPAIPPAGFHTLGALHADGVYAIGIELGGSNAGAYSFNGDIAAWLFFEEDVIPTDDQMLELHVALMTYAGV